MNLRKLDNGYWLQGKPLLIHRIATALGMENAKTSPIPETINEKAQDGDEESLTPSEARNFRTCVGKAMYLSHHRPDIQHSVNTLSRSMRNPTVIAMRRLKKLTRYLLGMSEVYQELCPDPHAETLQVPVDSDWADDRKTRQSCSGGAVLFHGCAVLTWGTHTEDKISYERRSRVRTALVQEQLKVWELHNSCENGNTKQYRYFRRTHRVHSRFASDEDRVE